MTELLKKLAPLWLSLCLVVSPALACLRQSASWSVEGNPPQTAPDNLTVEDVTIEGNRLVSTEDILGVVGTHRGDKFNRDQVLKDLKAINSMGYFDDRALQALPELKTGGVLLKIRVQENAPVTQFSFQGNEVVSTEEITRLFSNQLGKPQNLNSLSSAIDKVERAYHEKGYVLARVVDVKDDPDGTISVSINEGSVDEIKIVGNRKTKDFIIRNALKLKPGSVYNERLLTADLRKLYANGYFQDIRRSLAPSEKNPDKYVLKVEVDEKRTGSVGLGGGIDTLNGPFGSMSFSDSNFRGRGEQLSFSAQGGTGMFNGMTNAINNGGTQFLAGQRTFNVQANYVKSNILNSDTTMAISGFGRNFNSMMINYAMQRTIGTSVMFSRPLVGNYNFNLGLTGSNTSLKDASNLFMNQNTLSYLTERALATGQAGDATTAQALAQSVRNSQLKGGTYLAVNPSVTYDTRDNKADPTSGTLARLTSSPSLGIANSSFLKLGASVSRYVPITRNQTLAFNFQGGSAMGGVPAFGQYMLGGWNGVRGYRMFSDLGTGTSMLMGSAELRSKLPVPLLDPSSPLASYINPVLKNLKGAAFFDAGQVNGNSNVNSLYQRSSLGASVGFGIRVKLPMVGTVRLDYGFPLISSLLGKMTPRFTLGFGEKF